MAAMSFPPGFRFHPSDEEIIMYYLKRKALGKKLLLEAIAEVNVYNYSPWDLPDKSCLKNGDLEWFFFCAVTRKYSSGGRSNRATETGYWKSTGKDRVVKHKGRDVGMIKTLIFHQGHAPKVERTDWVIHEYRILDSELASRGVDQAAYVVMKLFKKNGLGPKNGAQYGAPFNEEDWDMDDNNEDENYAPTLPPLVVANTTPTSFNKSTFEYGSTSAASPQLPVNSSLSASLPESANLSMATGPNSFQTSVPIVPASPSEKMLVSPLAPNNFVISTEPLPNDLAPSVEVVDLDSLWAMVTGDDALPGPPAYDYVNEIHEEGFMELEDVFAGLDDLKEWQENYRRFD